MSAPIEFERKFLVKADRAVEVFALAAHSEPIAQAYFMQDQERCVRLRKRDAGWLLTFKKATGAVGEAFEVERDVAEAFALALLPMCESRVSKRRHYVQVGDFRWEVDQFLDHNEGLVMAEVELSGQAQSDRLTQALPEWIAVEVTGDPRYFNTWLATNVAPRA